MKKVIAYAHPIAKINEFSPTKLSPLQRQEIKDLRIPLELLNRRYHNIVERSKRRNATPPNRYAFIRALLYLIKKTASRNLKTPLSILKKYEVHSVNRHDYNIIQMLSMPTHRTLHASIKPSSALYKCKHCNTLKEKTEFIKNSKTKSGLVLVCHKCKYRLEKERKELKEEVA